jgi:hypothetical protein
VSHLLEDLDQPGYDDVSSDEEEEKDDSSNPLSTSSSSSSSTTVSDMSLQKQVIQLMAEGWKVCFFVLYYFVISTIFLNYLVVPSMFSCSVFQQ